MDYKNDNELYDFGRSKGDTTARITADRSATAGTSEAQLTRKLDVRTSSPLDE